MGKSATAGAFALSARHLIPGSLTSSDQATGSRSHPIDGIPREKIHFSDVKVTLLSYETPADKQWIPSCMPPKYLWWKTDSILVEVMTDQGITCIGGSSNMQ